MSHLKILTVVGARPQFIKAAAISRAVGAWNADHPEHLVEERIVHTGQHYDAGMSDVFFDELEIPRPWKNLEVGSGSHGKQTGKMMERLEEAFLEMEPDLLLTFGDTNSTLASALVAAKLHVPVAHVEAGLRSFNRRMPEEINRIVTDHVSTWLFCPSQTSVDHLAKEGVTNGVFVSGDVMYDAILFNQQLADQKSSIVQSSGFESGQYSVATVHRAENTDDKSRLAEIIEGMSMIGDSIVLPLHPRTKNCLEKHQLQFPDNVTILPPVPYLDMVQLVSHSRMVFTDSGGLQKEAYWMGKPCITMRDETEWTETVEVGWNRLTGGSAQAILAAYEEFSKGNLNEQTELYGDGAAAERILKTLLDSKADVAS